MKIKPLLVIKIGITAVVLLIVNFILPLDETTNTIIALLTLVMSGVLFYKSRNSVLMSLIGFLIFYSNYSIVVGEYFIGGRLGVPFNDLKTPYYYGLAIKVLFVFIFILALFLEGGDELEFHLQTRYNALIFRFLVLVLFYIMIFEVDRTYRLTYSVRISPLYEYSALLFLLTFYYSKGSVFSNIFLVALSSLFIVQDMIFGGRITSLQLMIFLAATVFFKQINFRRLLLGGLAAIFVNSVVGVYRSSYMLTSSLKDVFVSILNDYFVFDTPVYAYFASVTHIAASDMAGVNVRHNSLIAFIKSIFFSSRDLSANVTSLVAKNYLLNFGGGLMPTHFFFWLGWVGVVLIAIIVVLILNNISKKRPTDLTILVAVCITIYSPRWYLYSPLVFFRGPFVLMPVMYLLSSLADRVLCKR